MNEITQTFFSDQTTDYCDPAEPKENDLIRIRFRAATEKTLTVFLCYGGIALAMKRAETVGVFTFYEMQIRMGHAPIRYHFRIRMGDQNWVYNKIGCCEVHQPIYDFALVPGFSTPDWAKGAVMYQIFTDRFYNGDPSNDVREGEYFYIKRQVRKIDNWSRPPGDFDVTDFYGGDLAGVMQKLPYLKKLGVEVIYFNPLFVSPSSHKYDTQDYDYIDPHFGVILEDDETVLPKGSNDNSEATGYIRRVTDRRNLEAGNALFAQLVEQAHAEGIRVIIDGVFNHCGSFHKWLDREGIYSKEEGYETGAYFEKDSPYHDFFRFYDENAYPQNGSYDGWWGHDTLPKLNYENSKKLEKYILEIGKKWVSPPYNADGWRLDVAADLGHSKEYNHRFWKKFRRAVKEANPEAVIIAEHYGDPSDWLQGDQWDTVMNYDAFMEPVSWFLTGMEKHSEGFRPDLLGNPDAFFEAMRYHMARFSTSSLNCAMNQLSNHDHSRFLTRTNHKVGRAVNLGAAAASEGINKGVFRAAVVIQMTWPGAPTLYYGDEAGLCGFTDPDNRRAYPWGREDKSLIEFHRSIIALHKELPVLRTGSLIELYRAKNVIGYGRFQKGHAVIVIVNNDDYSRECTIDVWKAGVPLQAELTLVMYTNETGYSDKELIYPVEHGVLDIALPKHASIMMRWDEETDETI
jgi:alpha-glucosidase